MGKNSEIKFVGQPVFKQILNLINHVNMHRLITKHQSDRYYKAFRTRTHLITMLLGILSRCDSMTEICDGLRNKDSGFFEELYFSLVKRYNSFLSDSRTFGLTFKDVLLIDSTTIRLFSDMLKGVGRNLKGDGKKKAV